MRREPRATNTKGFSWDTDSLPDPYIRIDGIGPLNETLTCRDKLECTEAVDFPGAAWILTGKQLRTGFEIKVYDADGFWSTDPLMGSYTFVIGNSSRDGATTNSKVHDAVKSLTFEIHPIK